MAQRWRRQRGGRRQRRATPTTNEPPSKAMDGAEKNHPRIARAELESCATMDMSTTSRARRLTGPLRAASSSGRPCSHHPVVPDRAVVCVVVRRAVRVQQLGQSPRVDVALDLDALTMETPDLTPWEGHTSSLENGGHPRADPEEDGDGA
ncbi:hypothetical protein OsI_12588 [Oryza sativa Indica Group]|uniref:Uncharacterized protein n=1 Tax=Oryza sativa subsp. indica TaxID=39946 RepID=A2XJG9_ORYSI|nr:hypothetical protein OsI_12588 [Oryza sativa Indica Group]